MTCELVIDIYDLCVGKKNLFTGTKTLSDVEAIMGKGFDGTTEFSAHLMKDYSTPFGHTEFFFDIDSGQLDSISFYFRNDNSIYSLKYESSKSERKNYIPLSVQLKGNLIQKSTFEDHANFTQIFRNNDLFELNFYGWDTECWPNGIQVESNKKLFLDISGLEEEVLPHHEDDPSYEKKLIILYFGGNRFSNSDSIR